MWAKNNGYFSWFSQVRVLESGGASVHSVTGW